MERSWASSMMRHSTLYCPSNSKSRYFRSPPVPSRSQPQGGQQVVSQRSLTRVIFGSRYRKNRIASPSNHPCLTTRFISQIAYSHRLATPRLCYHDMPTPLSPGLLEKTL